MLRKKTTTNGDNSRLNASPDTPEGTNCRFVVVITEVVKPQQGNIKLIFYITIPVTQQCGATNLNRLGFIQIQNSPEQ